MIVILEEVAIGPGWLPGSGERSPLPGQQPKALRAFTPGILAENSGPRGPCGANRPIREKLQVGK